MISNKYPVGYHVYYIYERRKVYGTIVDKQTALDYDFNAERARDVRVYALWESSWNDDQPHVGFMPEKQVLSDVPVIKRKLPDWW